MPSTRNQQYNTISGLQSRLYEEFLTERRLSEATLEMQLRALEEGGGGDAPAFEPMTVAMAVGEEVAVGLSTSGPSPLGYGIMTTTAGMPKRLHPLQARAGCAFYRFLSSLRLAIVCSSARPFQCSDID